jgi:hypothetical protein
MFWKGYWIVQKKKIMVKKDKGAEINPRLVLREKFFLFT